MRKCRFERVEDRRVLATLTIDLHTDSDALVNDGNITLREAIRYVNGETVPSLDDAAIDEKVINGVATEPLGTNDTIIFSDTVFGTCPGLESTITLLHTELFFNSGGEFEPARDLTIDASMIGGGVTIVAPPIIELADPIDPDLSRRVFNFINVRDLTLDSLIILGREVSPGREAPSRPDGDDGRGGGVRIDSSGEVRIANTTISGHYASSGGGLFAFIGEDRDNVEQDASLTIVDSVISGNTAGDGGGLFVDFTAFQFGPGTRTYHAQSEGLRLTIERSRLLDNVASNRGGGLFTQQGAGSVTEIVDSTVSGNAAGIGRDNELPEFELPNSGGGIYAYLFSGDDPVGNTSNAPNNNLDPNDTDNPEARFILTRSTVNDNAAGEDGGGILICAKREDFEDEVRSIVEIDNSTVSGNRAAVNEDGEGGGLHLAVFQSPLLRFESEGLDVQITNTTITQNSATYGGGVFSRNNLITNNGQRLSYIDTRLHNTIIAGNTTLPGDGAASNYHGSINDDETRSNLFGPGNTFTDHLTEATISLSDLGSGNQIVADNDPLLGDLASNGGVTQTHKPLFESRAVDNGDDALAAGLTHDQRGEPFARVSRKSGGSAPRVDIGAVELLPGDYNLDAVVDVADFTVWRDTLGDTVPRGSGADGDGSGEITVEDYLIWRDNFGAGSSMDAAQTATALQRAIGDYNGDGVVDHFDYGAWEEDDPDADGNGDGVVDALDYRVWAEQIGSTATEARFRELPAGISGIIYYASNTDDELDPDHSYGDLSLREAVQLANAVVGGASIVLPAGRYEIDHAGVEAEDASFKDLDVTGDVAIFGDGAGVSVLEAKTLNVRAGHDRVFDVQPGGARLEIQKLTLTSEHGQFPGGRAVRVQSGSSLLIEDSALVGNSSAAGGAAVTGEGADITVRRSVFTGNDVYGPIGGGGAAILLQPDGPALGSLTIGETIFALNTAGYQGASYAQNIVVGSAVLKTNEGNNLYDDPSGGFFDTTPGTGDYLGSVDYVVTTVADTLDHSDNAESLSIREAVDLANQASSADTIWLPAWDFRLTRDRQTYGGGSATDTDVAFGDLDISDSLVVRGVSGETSVGWKPGVNDATFELLGDYDGNGYVSTDGGTGGDDLADIWDYFYSGSGTEADWEVYHVDGNDDGYVYIDDFDVVYDHEGNFLSLSNLQLS